MKKLDLVKKEIVDNKIIYLLLSVVLASALLVRIYRVGDLLGFYYDQGRDALVIWKLWHEGKPFLIGPITGLSGIFLGPFFYYLIAPFYLIGGGNPMYPAIFLSFISVLALLVLFDLGRLMHSRVAGLLAATIGGYSYYIFTHGRWLSNPNPILLSSTILLYSMWKVLRGGHQVWFIVIALMVGLSLQLEAASAVFYLPVVAIFFIWIFLFNDSRGGSVRTPDIKVVGVSVGIFLSTLIPQILFNIRHENLLLNNFKNLFFQEKAFKGVTKFILEERIKFFWMTFSNKLYAGWPIHALSFMLISFSSLVINKINIKKGLLTLFVIFLITPMVGYLFFQGNYGNIYDYYMSGYYLPFVLLFSIGLAEIWKTKFGKTVIVIFLITFFQLNGMLVRNYIAAGTDGPTHISLGNQLEAVEWVFQDSEGKGEFNVDVYVPPVIPHAYDYLFLWQGTRRCGDSLCGMHNDIQISILYTLYESDPPHPERLEAWLSRQKGIGVVENEEKFGGITVQRRRRI